MDMMLWEMRFSVRTDRFQCMVKRANCLVTLLLKHTQLWLTCLTMLGFLVFLLFIDQRMGHLSGL